MKLGAKQGAFRSIWVHLGSFRKYMKVGAKHTELVQLLQKFVPRSHVYFFATNALDPPHWTVTHVLVRLIMFGCIWDRFVTA